jgi:hypothetical protein
MSTIRIATAAALLASAAAVAVPVASAKDGDGVRVRGACTAGSASKLKLSREEGRVEVEFEVDQNRNGVPWKVTLRRNGRVVTSTTAVTRAPSGSFTVRRVVAGGRIAAVATRASERCSASASF